MFTEQLRVFSLVHAKDLVAHDVALLPLNARPHFFEHSAGLLRNPLEVGWRQSAGTRNIPLNKVGFHGGLSFRFSAGGLSIGGYTEKQQGCNTKKLSLDFV